MEGNRITVAEFLMAGGTTSLNTEDGNLSEIQIKGETAELCVFEQDAWILLPVYRDGIAIWINEENVSIDDVIKVAENLPL